MAASSVRKKLILQIVEAAAEALTLEDIGRNALPMFEKLVGGSTSLLYNSRKNQPFIPVAGGIAEGLPEYAARFANVDPLQQVMKRQNPCLFVGTRCHEWRDFRAHRALAEFSNRRQISWFLHLRLSPTGHMDPGFVGIVCGREARRPDFSDGDAGAAAAVLPSLNAAVRRAGRLATKLSSAEVTQALLERMESRVLLALNLQGGILWISSKAERILAPYLGGRRTLPEPLTREAKRLAAIAEGKNSTLAGAAPFSVSIPTGAGPPLHAELFLAQTASGDKFVVVDLGGGNLAPDMTELVQRHGLTRTETEVLGDLAQGLSNAEIAGRRFVSIPTIETHMTRILNKLGARSRLHAAVLALRDPRLSR